LKKNEKLFRGTQTLHAGCSKVKPKIFFTAANPLPGGARRPKSNQMEMVTTFIDLQIQFGEDRCTQFRVIVVTDPHRPPTRQPQTGGRLQYTASRLSAQCNNASQIYNLPSKQSSSTWHKDVLKRHPM